MKQLVEFLINSKSTGIIKDPDFVDLGLSVLWSKYNIGAEKETDYGHYYQWGGLKHMDNKICDWSHAPFNNTKIDCDEEYFESIKDKVCSNNILLKEYDIAFQTYKDNKVHIPTEEQCTELIKKTIAHNTTIDGVDGIKFINTSDDSKYIFIPFSGCRDNFSFEVINKKACIWSSNINYRIPDSSWAILFSRGNNEIFNFSRHYGFSVRAVKDK